MTPLENNIDKNSRNANGIGAENPQVTFIVTNYNYGRYLPEAIKSIVNQTWDRIELIIVDDGSVDDSSNVICDLESEYKDRFTAFRKFLLPANSGKLHALNLAIPEVTSPITIIFDADDVLEPEFTERTVGALLKESKKDSSVAFVYSDCMFFMPSDDGVKRSRSFSNEFDAKLLENHSYIPETAPTYTHALKHLGDNPFDDKIRKYTKHHKWKLLVNAGYTGIYLPEALLNYRIHDSNLSGISKDVFKNGASKNVSAYWKRSP